MKNQLKETKGHKNGGLEDEHHGALDHQDGGKQLRVPQEGGGNYAEKAAGGDWEGGRLYQILVLIYIWK